jgi:DNA topoisomerase-1
MPALVHVSDDEPGIERHGRSRFQYLRQTNRKPVRSGRDLNRINALAIPPAWTDVWICADPQGHIQATGRDARGRKQYRYHPAYRRRRERRKFDQLVPFGEALGGLRTEIDRDLRHPQLDRERVLAAVISLLELTYVRIGNEAYARENRSYGLTTLRCSHVDIEGSQLRLHFRGKGGKWIDVACCDPRLARVVRRCQELPGQQLFQYEDADGVVAHVTSTDVNDYLREITGLDATAKTFRTWGATLMAAEMLAGVEPPTSERAATRVANEILRDVAAQLGNTLAVCRASYVHPVVLDSFARGSLQEAWEKGPTRARNRVSASERKLLRLLSATA